MMIYLYINRGRYVHAILCPRPCVAAKPPRVAAKPRAVKPRVAAKPRKPPRVAAKPPCDPPCGRAHLVNIKYAYKYRAISYYRRIACPSKSV